MAAINLLQGFGGQYSTTFTAVSTSSTGSDTLDCTKAFALAVTLASTSTGAASSNTVQLQQSFNGGTSWVNLLTAITAGSSAVFPSTSFPFGLIRLVGSVANGTLTVTVTGFALPDNF